MVLLPACRTLGLSPQLPFSDSLSPAAVHCDGNMETGKAIVMAIIDCQLVGI